MTTISEVHNVRMTCRQSSISNMFQEIWFEYSYIFRINGYNLIDATSATAEMLLLFMNLYRPVSSSRLDPCATAVTTASVVVVRRTISRRTGVQLCVQPVFRICECFLYHACGRFESP